LDPLTKSALDRYSGVDLRPELPFDGDSGPVKALANSRYLGHRIFQGREVDPCRSLGEAKVLKAVEEVESSRPQL
jgi:hypothetical protein